MDEKARKLIAELRKISSYREWGSYKEAEEGHGKAVEMVRGWVRESENTR